MMPMAEEIKSPSLLSFKGNLDALRALAEKISRVRTDLLELRDERKGKGKRKKLERELTDLNAEYRRLLLKILVGGGVVLGAADGLAMGALRLAKLPIERAGVTPIKPFQPHETDYTRRMIELQNYWRGISLDALNRFRNADPQVGELIEFMEKNAVTSIPQGPVITIRVTPSPSGLKSPGNPHEFEIVYMPEEYAAQMRSSIVSEGSTIRVAANFRSEEWLGIMLGHEMIHIKDLLVNGENIGNPEEWLAGEVRAHLFEMKLLREWRPANYEELISKGIPLFEAGDGRALERLIEELYPVDPVAVSFQEGKLGRASCLSAVAFESTLRRGGTSEDLKKVYQRILSANARR